jgi:three-Cys-motif partner protein
MPPAKTTHWRIEPHTQTKHLILRNYLQAWLPIMASRNGRIHFLDGFAGPGKYEGGEKGSPLIALETLIQHPHFRKPLNQREILLTFIEKDKDRAEALEAAISEYRVPEWIKISVLSGEFAPLMKSVLETFEAEHKQLAPTFALLDPFGFKGIPLDLIARIASNPSCECFITFMYEEINRFLGFPDLESRYDDLFGTPEWREITKEQDASVRRVRIADLYRKQLVTKAKFRYVREFQMINDRNHTKYFLYFGTNHEQGLSHMKQAMWKADPGGGQVFSDRTNPDQETLFKTNPDLTQLRMHLLQRFRGQGWVPVGDVERFVLVDTPFSERMHLKQKTLAPMERNSLIETRRPAVGRRGTYPPGTQIKFL